MRSKYLNKVIVGITAFSLLFALGSCKKYLDQQPITSVGPEQVFSDVPTTLQALAGVYSRLTGDNGYGLQLSLYYPVDNDILMGPSGNTDDRRGLAHFTLTSLNTEVNATPSPFTQLFEGIMLANVCIDQIPKMALYSNGTDQQKKQLQRMYGEALTLRAQFYFEAIRNWGDLPEHFLPSYVQATENPLPTRADRDGLYDHILADLLQAESLVPWRNEVTSIGDPVDERITKGTVKGLRARIALFRGGWSLRQDGTLQRAANYLDFYKIARDETNDIIASNQHSLYPSYKGLWKDIVCGHQTVDPNGELMFQVSQIQPQETTPGSGGSLNSSNDSRLGWANGPRFNTRGNSFVNPLPSYLYLFDSTDVRRDVTIAPYDVVTTNAVSTSDPATWTKTGQPIGNLRDGKYRVDWIRNPVVPKDFAGQVGRFGLKWQILRYSDVLLMYAEAENEINGPTSSTGAITPLEALNRVRRRSITAAPGVIVDITSAMAPDKAAFFKFLVRERALELGAEGIRKYDLIRWNLLGAGLRDAWNNMTLMMNRSTTPMSYSYMAGPPGYAAVPSLLPSNMYMRTTAPLPTGDDMATLWVNNYYTVTTGGTPTGTTSFNWVNNSTSSTALGGVVSPTLATPRYGYPNFKSGKHELLPIPQSAIASNPNLTQNPGY